MIKDDEINRGGKRCCNVVLFPPATPAPRFLLASRQNCHACSYVWCYGFARERETVKSSTFLWRVDENDTMVSCFRRNNHLKWRKRIPQEKNATIQRENDENLAVLSLFSWAFLSKTYPTTFLQNILWTAWHLLILTTVKSTKKAETSSKCCVCFMSTWGRYIPSKWNWQWKGEKKT